MDIPNIVSKLHPLERTILPALASEKDLHALCAKTGLDETEATRAVQWLENKGAVTIQSTSKKMVSLGKNGLLYKKEGLPEKTFLNAMDAEFKGLNVILKKSKLSRDEGNACLGLLRGKKAIEVQQATEGMQLRITNAGKLLRQQKTPEELFLEQNFPLEEHLADARVLQELKKRRDFVKVEERKQLTITLTDLGKQLSALDLRQEVVNRLTPGMLKDGSWAKKQFRAYDVEINVPKKYGGKKHFVTQATEYAKKIWMDMGFKEMTGNMVHTSFWNFDALFTAQDHPVREMQDTYFLGGMVEKGKLPPEELVKKIRQVHEQGGKTGSTGWGGTWDEEEAKRNVLRTHTTVLTAQTLAQLKREDLPAKFFALGKNFRNEAIDWKHLNEFNQTEGIVVDKNANFRHLLGYLKQFFGKMGFPDARFRPAFFPYTSPSVEIDVFHPVKKEWVEFGGAGMLRPEVVVPLLGEDIPVLAWGPGFDRTIMEYWNIMDMRELYKNDMKQLREFKMWLK